MIVSIAETARRKSEEEAVGDCAVIADLKTPSPTRSSKAKSAVSSSNNNNSKSSQKSKTNNSRMGNNGSTPTPSKLRRKVTVDETLNVMTSGQRLVEYFLVVSSQPRWQSSRGATGTTPSGKNNTTSSCVTPPVTPDRERQSLVKSVTTPSLSERDVNSDTPAIPFSERRKNFSKKLNTMFKRKPKTGTENAIDASISSQDYDHDASESRDEPMPPPRRRSTWKKEESEGHDQNIHIPETADEHTFQPRITARYPLTDHEDHPLNPMVTQFCYPAGEFIVPSRDYEMPRLHHFVLTNEKGQKVYGTCLTVYDEYHPEKNTPWERQDMVSDSPQGVEVTVQDQTSCLYLPRCLCILSALPYVTAFREYLAQLYRLATSTDCMNAPIERYIMNLCDEIPAPPPGAFEVQVNILDSVIRFWSPPAKLPIAYVSLPYQTLFDCLDVENILHLWYCLTMERKVLLVSSQYTLLTVCSEILCSLLYPMKWSHLYVPLLPRFLSPMLDAPVPYLCGVTRDNWLHVQQFVSEETIVVDLDRNNVMFGERTESLPSLPGKKWLKLQDSLEDVAGHLFWRTRGLGTEYKQFRKNKLKKGLFKKVAKERGEFRWNEKLETFDQAYNLQFTPDSEHLNLNDSVSEQEQNKWDRLQEAFLRFFVALLKDYRRFLHTPDADSPLSPPPGSNDWIQWSKRRWFDRDGFLASQKPEYVPYLSELCMTQQFDDFITKRLYSPEMPDIIFFDQSIDAKLNRSRMKIKKVDTPFLHSAKAHKVLKSFLAVDPNTSSLPSDPPFMYKSWPDTFETSLFCKPRPIPRIITAEFDRQAALVSQLKASSPNVEDDADLLDFYGSDYDDSPEGMAYTVFFFVYCAVIGREWQQYQQKRRLEEASTAVVVIDDDSNCHENDEAGGRRDSIEVTALQDTSLVPGISDQLCDPCPNGGAAAVDDAVDYVTTKSPCAKYANEINAQAQLAREAIVAMGRTSFNNGLQSPEASLLDNDETFAEYEEAKEVALAQLGLAFDTLESMEKRGLLADPDIFKSLMQASGRCGDTKRALELIEKMKRDGLAADTSVLSCFIEAFAHDISSEPPIEDDFILGRQRSDAYSTFLIKKLEGMTAGSTSSTLLTGVLSSSEEESSASDIRSDTGSEGSFLSTNSPKQSINLFEWFTPHKKKTRRRSKLKKKLKRARRNSQIMATAPASDRLVKQLVLGETLLDFLYPDLKIDTRCDACPKCSELMGEVDIVSGWQSCEFQDYTTTCKQCSHQFVPKFSVSSSSPTFVGSQGPGTPLFCEFLSPWVLRKELDHIVQSDDGVDLILDPGWRSGCNINSTLWWNLVAMFQRYELPFSFLLQGSFQNRLISPVPQD